MPVSRLNWILALACCLLPRPALASDETKRAAKRLYVEAFATKADAEKLREDVTAELQKLNSVSLVPDESSADFVLGGGGEVWIRGYRSFSPRSHVKEASNGTPIYGGFLSVELKDKRGVTIWSHLVTPGRVSGDFSRDLSKQIAKDLAEALSQPDTPPRHRPRLDPPSH